MNKFLTWSAHTDSEERFGTFMMTNAIFACIGFFIASVILTVAMFLLPSNDILMLFWIWWSFGVVGVSAWVCSRVAFRKPVSRWFEILTNLFMCGSWCFVVYAAFYCGVWSIIHPFGEFSFDLRWKSVLFTVGGFLALLVFRQMSSISRAIEERIRLFEAGLVPQTKS
ncbi:MAG TPA: hypothetical protein DCP63_10360 [Bacteroidetes bacterium]|nr:hypothetical protein [Bacteroidota bacterium]